MSAVLPLPIDGYLAVPPDREVAQLRAPEARTTPGLFVLTRLAFEALLPFLATVAVNSSLLVSPLPMISTLSPEKPAGIGSA